MREKYESLSLATLKELAKARGLKGISALRKPELVQRMLEEDEKESSLQNENTPKGREEVKQYVMSKIKVCGSVDKAEVRADQRQSQRSEVKADRRQSKRSEVRADRR